MKLPVFASHVVATTELWCALWPRLILRSRLWLVGLYLSRRMWRSSWGNAHIPFDDTDSLFTAESTPIRSRGRFSRRSKTRTVLSSDDFKCFQYDNFKIMAFNYSWTFNKCPIWKRSDIMVLRSRNAVAVTGCLCCVEIHKVDAGFEIL